MGLLNVWNPPLSGREGAGGNLNHADLYEYADWTAAERLTESTVLLPVVLGVFVQLLQALD